MSPDKRTLNYNTCCINYLLLNNHLCSHSGIYSSWPLPLQHNWSLHNSWLERIFASVLHNHQSTWIRTGIKQILLDDTPSNDVLDPFPPRVDNSEMLCYGWAWLERACGQIPNVWSALLLRSIVLYDFNTLQLEQWIEGSLKTMRARQLQNQLETWKIMPGKSSYHPPSSLLTFVINAPRQNDISSWFWAS